MRTMFVVLPMMLWFASAEAARGSEKLRTHAYDGILQALAISNDGGQYAVAVSPLDNVLVYQREGGRVVARAPRDLGHTRALAFSPDGKTVAYSVMGGDGKKHLYPAIRVLPVDKATAAFDLKGPRGDVDRLTFSSDGSLLAAGQIDGAVFLWEVGAKTLVLQSDKQAAPITLAFTSNGRILASASKDRTLLRWDVKSRKLLQESAMETPALAARYTRDGKQLLVGTLAGEIEEWPAAGDRPRRVIPLRDVKGPVDLLALSPDATRAATVYKNAILVFDLATGKLLAKLAHSKGYEISCVAFSEDGAFLLSGATGLPVLPRNDFASEVILWGIRAEKSSAALTPRESPRPVGADEDRKANHAREQKPDRPSVTLSERCQKMLDMQIAVYAETKSLQKSIQGHADKKARIEDKAISAKLAQKQKGIIVDATETIEFLKAEGAAAAFPEVFVDLRADMKCVQSRLEMSDVGRVTQIIETDIIENLKEMIQALKTCPGPEQERLTPEQAKEALLKMMRSKAGKDFGWFNGAIPDEMAKLEIKKDKDGWYAWTAAFRINPSKEIYTLVIRPRPGDRACIFEYEGSFVRRNGAWSATVPKLVRMALQPGE